jgi:hypothetical protein
MTTKRRDGKGEPFGDWIRSHPGLDSIRERLSVTDSDYWIHQYRSHRDKVGSRAVDSIMLLEVKTFFKDVEFAQRDTLHIVHQLLRIASVGTDGKRRFVRVKGTRASERRIARCFGVHVLRMTSDRPETSGLMYWDGMVVDEGMLVELLSFIRDPDHPRRFLSTARRHHTPTLSAVLQLPLLEAA